jgi:hemerythrin-like domain-containing protein
MDAITMLKDDHKAVKALFRKYEAQGENAVKTKQQLVEQITHELEVHTSVEEQVFYDAVKREVPDERGDVLEGFEEHRVADRLLQELAELTPDDETFDAKVTVLIEAVRHHVSEEEDDLFPAVRKELGRKRLTELGDELAAAKAAHGKRVTA